MKIGFFGTRMDLISGHSRPALELARHLQARGHQIRVLTSRLSPPRQQYHDSLPASGEVKIERAFTSYFDLYKINRILKEFIEDCDVIHEFSPYGLSLVPGVRQRTVPTVISIVNNLRVSTGTLLGEGPFSMGYGLPPRFLINTLLPRFVLKNLLGRAQAIIAWTDFTYRQISDIGIRESLISHIPVGIDHARFTVETLHNKPGEPTFLYLGPLSPIQGVDVLINAFARFHTVFPSSHLIIADRGPDLAADTNRHRRFKDRCLHMINEAGLSNHVTWKGFVPEPSMLLNSADAVVLPYQIALGYSQPPLTLIEALIHGKPVISTLCGSVPEFIVSGENGILVQPGDPAALARGMHQFATRSLAHRAEEIRSSVIHKHDWPAIVDTHLRVYEGVLQAAGS